MKVNVADFANLTLFDLPAKLRRKLDAALLVPTDDVPPDLVTMLSRVVVADLATGRRREVGLVYPADADMTAGRISVLDPLGMALFGVSVGDAFECELTDGRCRLRVESMLYQPEHWMRNHLVVRE